MKKNETTFKFEPAENIRKFHAKDLINKMVTVKLQHTDEKNTNQYVSAQSPVFRQYELYGINGWADKVLGKKETEIKRKITSVTVLEHMNGGRRDYNEYESYWDYFNKNKKQEVMEYWKGGLLARIGRGGGNLDQIDIKIKFHDFEIEDNCIFDFKAPEEWYSELYQGDTRFKFADGFYKDANEALHFFDDKPVDDIFGRRYFPVIVFPKNTKADVRSIADYAKASSKAIVTEQHIVFGTRCKPDEIGYVISQTYEACGQVARARQWDWEG